MNKMFKVLAALLAVCSYSVSAASIDKDTYTSKSYTKSMKEHLISAQDALKLIGKKGVVFVSGDSHDTYESIGHIKGSVEMYAHHLHHADITGHMHCAPLFMCPDEAEEFISKHGISNEDLIIAYDNFRGPNATGVWTFFKSWGHKNVKILNGGMDAIKAIDPAQIKVDNLKKERKKYKTLAKKAKKEGDAAKANEYKAKEKALKKEIKSLAKTTIIQKGKHKGGHKGHYKIDPDKIDLSVIAGKDEVKKAMKDILAKGDKSKYVIIDTRGMTEIMGERKMDNVARGGHIPGAKFIEWKNLTDFDRKLSYRDLNKIKKLFERHGVTKDKTIYAYCHVGAGRSTHIQVALRMLGYKNVKAYSGSWDEWGNDMNLPIYK